MMFHQSYNSKRKLIKIFFSKLFSYSSVSKIVSFFGDLVIHEQRAISDPCKQFNIMLVRSRSHSCPLAAFEVQDIFFSVIQLSGQLDHWRKRKRLLLDLVKSLQTRTAGKSSSLFHFFQPKPGQEMFVIEFPLTPLRPLHC